MHLKVQCQVCPVRRGVITGIRPYARYQNELQKVDRRVKPSLAAPRGAVRLEDRAAAAARAFLSARVPRGIRVRIGRWALGLSICSARPPAPALRRCYPRASPPPQDAHQLQES